VLYPLRDFVLSFRRKMPLHAGVESPRHHLVPYSRLRDARDFLMSWPHPMRVQHALIYGVILGHDGVPMPIESAPAHPWFLVFDERGAVWVKSKLAAEVAQNFPRVVARHFLFRGYFVMPQRVFRARRFCVAGRCVHLLLAAL
jgi:hypothetical protein